MKKISLTRGQIATVDDADYERISAFKWTARKDSRTGKFSAMRMVKRKVIPMSVEILGSVPFGKEVDHRNGDTLLNTRANLRIATRTEQQRNRRLQKNNTSGYKGVDWFKAMSKWRAKIKVNRVQYVVGYFDSKEDAARAYDAKAQELFGEFAVLNFPTGE